MPDAMPRTWHADQCITASAAAASTSCTTPITEETCISVTTPSFREGPLIQECKEHSKGTDAADRQANAPGQNSGDS